MKCCICWATSLFLVLLMAGCNDSAQADAAARKAAQELAAKEQAEREEAQARKDDSPANNGCARN